MAGRAWGSRFLCTVDDQERVITVALQVCMVGGVYMAVSLACFRCADGLAKRGIAMT